MANVDIPSVASKLYEVLEPLESPIRARVIKAALTMLGDHDTGLSSEIPGKRSQETDGGTDGAGLPRKVQAWMRSHSVSEGQLNQVFHTENGKAELIASESPGKTGKDRTISAYLLTGLTQFLETGEAKFDDKSARATCKSLGCFDEGNHAYNLKGKGNWISGNKDSGWTLTGPGLKAGADLVKSMGGTD